MIWAENSTLQVFWKFHENRMNEETERNKGFHWHLWACRAWSPSRCKVSWSRAGSFLVWRRFGVVWSESRLQKLKRSVKKLRMKRTFECVTDVERVSSRKTCKKPFYLLLLSRAFNLKKRWTRKRSNFFLFPLKFIQNLMIFRMNFVCLNSWTRFLGKESRESVFWSRNSNEKDDEISDDLRQRARAGVSLTPRVDQWKYDHIFPTFPYQRKKASPRCFFLVIFLHSKTPVFQRTSRSP